MIFDLAAKSISERDLTAVLESFAADRPVRVSGLQGSARALYYTLLQRHLNMPLLIVTAGTAEAERRHSDLEYLQQCFGGDPSGILLYPSPDTEPYQGTGPHPQISVLRMQALWRLSEGKVRILTAPAEAALRRIAPVRHFQRCVSALHPGEKTGPGSIVELLQIFGYKEKDLVTSRGEYSQRGGILDFFSPAEPLPVRLEFFGNEIESMRFFDSNTQRSVREAGSITILSLREMQLTRQEIDSWGEFCRNRWSGEFYHEELADKTEQLLQFGAFDGYEEFTSAFFADSGTLIDFLPKDSCVVLEEPALLEQACDENRQRYRKRFEQVHEQYRVALEPEEMFVSCEDFNRIAQGCYRLLLNELTSQPDFTYSFQSARQYHGQVQEIVNDTLRLHESGYTNYFVMPTLGRAERMTEILREYDAPALFFHSADEAAEGITADQLPGKVILTLGNLSRGFKNAEHKIALYSEDDLFGESRPVPQTTTRKAAGAFLSDLRDLKNDDYVVHVDHGIAQFLGLSRMHMEGQEREFLLLQFAEDDKLYVPVERLDLVQKYMGAGEAAPRLDKLGTNVWQKTKARARASMKQMAEKLLELYAYRKTVRGFAFNPDDALQREFEEAFEFVETVDQMAAIEDVKADMESDKPMDRLICGDVGYGKTEVAMRATFKAVRDGKQVAVLAPTTILAFQHFHTFRKRFEMFPVTIDMVSRFRSRQEIKKTLEQVREGKIDILIGTHRLLSKDVQFHDLGVLIVDEEQRFGVAHKERLKEIKKNVDSLTLSATPIPRTLQMALMGFRPMSVIETPPKDRLAIQTNIVKYNEDVIADSIRAELKRGGQVYLVHNRVETIHSIAALVKRLVEDARVITAHGQMDESELEKVMMQFINHEHDVLVSTTIIENGIDIPLVNTLIVNRADRFGLSQLYQLRGRVGRSHRRAYAYFLIPSERELTPVARKRLSALREFTELGSGFRLAALDLEIRGAGNLLGSEQHGHIAALGFELYIRMLEQTIREMQGEEPAPEFSTNINLHVDIRIPEEYIPNMNQRLNIYKRIAGASSEERLATLREEISDRFGPAPLPVQNLLEYGRLKCRAEKLQIRSIDVADGHVYFQLQEKGAVQLETLLSFLKKNKGASLTPALVLSYPGEKLHVPETLFSTVQGILQQLSPS